MQPARVDSNQNLTWAVYESGSHILREKEINKLSLNPIPNMKGCHLSRI